MGEPGAVSFAVETIDDDYPKGAAEIIRAALVEADSVVLTGGTTAEKIYAELARPPVAWERKDVLFSDERCVPPGDPASNFSMAERLLALPASDRVHRMRGEESPPHGAELYAAEIRPLVERGIDLVLLGMGADAHIGAMYPGSLAVAEGAKLCVAVDRPDGMNGLTLTPPAVLSGKKVLVLVSGAAKADTVARVIQGNDGADACPARVLAQHPDVTFVLDRAAAGRL